MNVLFIFFGCALVSNVLGFINPYRKIEQVPLQPEDDPGEPLFLTPLIQAGRIQEAQRLSEVKFSQFGDVKSFSGYFTVNRAAGSNLFFWYFPAESQEAAPVVLWLQGGPGASSLFGLFQENGPFEVTEKGVKKRRYRWSLNHNVIYIDNPAGTGYSFTTSGFAENETAVGADLYTALIQFLQLFPTLQTNDFIVAGESYGGKYAPAIAYTISKNNPSATLKINLKGVSMGNGFSDPEYQLAYSDYLYQIGLIDFNTKLEVLETEKKAIELIRSQQWKLAYETMDNLIDGDMTPGHKSLFRNSTGFTTYYNLLVTDSESKPDYMGDFIQRPDVRKAIHVGHKNFSTQSVQVEKYLVNDTMQSVAPWISELLSTYKVLVYNGQLDIIVAYPLTVNYLKNLEFDSSDAYKNAVRHVWRVGDEIAGYFKQAGNLTEVLVRDAGHMVPADQPRWAFDLITRFTRNKSFH